MSKIIKNEDQKKLVTDNAQSSCSLEDQMEQKSFQDNLNFIQRGNLERRKILKEKYRGIKSDAALISDTLRHFRNISHKQQIRNMISLQKNHSFKIITQKQDSCEDSDKKNKFENLERLDTFQNVLKSQKKSNKKIKSVQSLSFLLKRSKKDQKMEKRSFLVNSNNTSQNKQTADQFSQSQQQLIEKIEKACLEQRYQYVTQQFKNLLQKNTQLRQKNKQMSQKMNQKKQNIKNTKKISDFRNTLLQKDMRLFNKQRSQQKSKKNVKKVFHIQLKENHSRKIDFNNIQNFKSFRQLIKFQNKYNSKLINAIRYIDNDKRSNEQSCLD